MNQHGSEFLLYENRPNNKAVGHHRSCSHVRKNGGKDVATGCWKEFKTRAEVENAGARTGRPFWWCNHCHGLQQTYPLTK